MANNNDLKVQSAKQTSNLKQRSRGMLLKIRQNPVLAGGVIGLVLILLIVFAGGDDVQSHQLVKTIAFESNSR